MKTKFIFVTGGVISSLGKGIIASSIGQLLKSRGYKIFMIKFDPYINIDPANMSPLQHGEVFVTDDGAQTDLDLGHYERFIDENLSKYSSLTTGKIYQKVIERERTNYYKGSTVQVIPHITDEIKKRLKSAAKHSDADIVICEVGGTVGDIESLPFIEAIRQTRRDFGFSNTLFLHTTYVPYLRSSNEIKTKPTQHSIKELRSIGIQPDIIFLRSEIPIPKLEKDKIALYSDLPLSAIYDCIDVNILYEVIINVDKQKTDEYILNHFLLPTNKSNITPWVNLVNQINKTSKTINIALVGKYVALHDAYMSVVEALKHAAYYHNVNVNINWYNAEKLNRDNVNEALKNNEGIIVPGGFGERGVDGLIATIQYARTKNIPIFGICYGMQMMTIEYARGVLNMSDANTTELDSETKHPLFILNPKSKDVSMKETGLILGLNEIKIKTRSKLFDIYQNEVIYERHRHRYEFNNDFVSIFSNSDFSLNAINTKTNNIEAIELANHKFFIGVQYHPEFKSRPLRAHPLFISFIKASLE